jgi:hypothetical protein
MCYVAATPPCTPQHPGGHRLEATHRSQFLQDILTDDEIISDSYDLKLIDGVAYEADCKKISVGGETFGAPLCPAPDCTTAILG